MTPAETVDAFIAALERKDLEAALELLAEDVEYDNVPMGKVHGREQVRATLGPMITACSTIEWVVHRQAAQDHLVLNERLDRFEMPFGWLEVPVAGVWEVHDGLITLWRDYFDEPTYRRQLPGGAGG